MGYIGEGEGVELELCDVTTVALQTPPHVVGRAAAVGPRCGREGAGGAAVGPVGRGGSAEDLWVLLVPTPDAPRGHDADPPRLVPAQDALPRRAVLRYQTAASRGSQSQ